MILPGGSEEANMPSEKLRGFLEEQGVRYEVLPHTTAYTSQKVAEAVHVRGRDVAKAVILKADGRFVMAVLPAPSHVDLDLFRAAIRAQSVSLAAEAEFRGLFPECETGAEPPFGNLYGLPVWVDEPLTKDASIVFNAGTHTEAVRMAYSDYARLVQPKVARFGKG
jgi:Ala-tRNA(Pro) deacylase